MLLTFSKPKFEGLIKENIKQHTIRADKNNRWKVGMSIQFWSGNPRNTRSKNKPYQFGVGVCSKIEPIDIFPDKNIIIIGFMPFDKIEELNSIACNDGFKDWEEMKSFFSCTFRGKLIFWDECVWS